MSYRDLRNFSEAMRVLGYPTPISLESFRTPNWAVIEEALRWLAARIEPGAALAGGGGSVDDRVALVTHAISLFHSRANLKLNGKKLYGADGWAVRELLKVASLLRAALSAPAGLDPLAGGAPLNYDVTNRLGEIKQARILATDITAQGAFLYDLLSKEPENKEHRDQALSRPLDMAAMESCIRRALDVVSLRLTTAKEQIDNVAASEAALDAKLERRRAELTRAEKRLHTVQKIKPVYAGELSALEAEIEQLWEQYVLRYRVLEALKHQLATLEAAQNEAAEEQQAAIMQLIQKYETEDVLGKLSDSESMDSMESGGEGSEARPPPRPAPRPATRPRTRLRIKTAAAGGDAVEQRRGFGRLSTARGSPDIRDEDTPSDDDLSDAQLYGDGGAGWGRRPATRTLPNRDDDDLSDLIQGVDGGDGDSLGSSSESELRLTSARPKTAQGRNSALSDNEF